MRRGFTLVELMLGIVLLALVGGSMYGALLSMERVQRAQTEQAQVQGTVRAAALILATELREVGFDTSTAGGITTDLRAISATSLRFLASRGLGITCEIVTTGTPAIRFLASSLVNRAPAESDTLRVFVEKNVNTGQDDVWARARVTGGVSTTANCPGGVPAVTLSNVTLYDATTGATIPLTEVKVGGPARWFELMEYGLYDDAGRTWLGARILGPVTPAFEPVLGPLTPGGLAFSYFDATGAVTTDLRRIRYIDIALQGITERPVNLAGASAADERTFGVRTRVALRNALRP
jgi:prepilin-type N-terminal cleavage/methylation domain-containing protein